MLKLTGTEIDEAFIQGFIYSLYKHKQENPAFPHHGLDLPVQPSALISHLISPYLPVYSPQQAQHYNIKKTSWKTVKKFIKYMQKQGLVKSKDRDGQETVIVDVNFNDRRIQQFVPYKLPSRNVVENAGKPVKKAEPADDGIHDPAVGQTLTIQSLHRPTVKLTPEIFPPLSGNDPRNFYKYSDVSKRLDEYLSSQDPPIISPENKRIILLNEFLIGTVFTSSSSEDKSAIARRKVTRDGLLKRLVEDRTLLAPYHSLTRPGQTEVKPKAGSAPRVTITLERRTGTKTATKVMNLEVFGIIPSLLADELQKKCASSTAVAQAAGATRGIMEIFVQGDQRRAIETALVRRGVKAQWIDVIDRTQKKKN